MTGIDYRRPKFVAQSSVAQSCVAQLTAHLLVQVSPAGSYVINAAGRNAVVTALMICCGFIVCFTPYEIIAIITIDHTLDYGSWYYHPIKLVLPSH